MRHAPFVAMDRHLMRERRRVFRLGRRNCDSKNGHYKQESSNHLPSPVSEAGCPRNSNVGIAIAANDWNAKGTDRVERRKADAVKPGTKCAASFVQGSLQDFS